jgi:hypothetical protein
MLGQKPIGAVDPSAVPMVPLIVRHRPKVWQVCPAVSAAKTADTTRVGIA